MVVFSALALSAGVVAAAKISPKRSFSKLKSFCESMGFPAKATILSPAFRPALAAMLLGITLSMVLGIMIITKRGDDLSMFSKSRLPGMGRLMCLPWRTKSTRVAVAKSRKKSASKVLNSPFSVPRSTSPSLNPRAFASELNFIPAVISFTCT